MLGKPVESRFIGGEWAKVWCHFVTMQGEVLISFLKEEGVFSLLNNRR